MASSETHYTLPKPRFEAPVKLLIVVAPYYKDVADQLLKGARAAIEAAGGTHDTVEVPGALEIPQAMALAARLSNYDGYVGLGCVIRGETTHYETVCNDSSRGLMMLGLQGLCVGNGILTVENRVQAEVRAEAAGQNKGGGAAEAALHLIALARRWSGTSRPVGFQPGGEFQVAGKPAGTDLA